MLKKNVIVGLMVLFASASSVMAKGPAASDRIGAFGKGGIQSRTVTELADKPSTQAAAEYVCPMGCAKSHEPGKCPKCGMQLKKVEKSKAKAEDHEKHQH